VTGVAQVPGTPALTTAPPRRGYPPIWALAVALAAFGFAVLVYDYHPLVARFPAEAGLSTGLMVLTGALGWWVVRRARPFRSPPRRFSAACLAWGMTAATGCAILANGGLTGIWAKLGGIRFASDWSAALTAPLNEELLKLAGLALLALATPRLIRGPIDGFLYGATVGLGFQIAENWTYAMNNIVFTGGTAGQLAVIQSFGVRVLLTGLGSHWAMTAVAGTGLAIGMTRRGWAGRWPATIGLILLAMAMHFSFDAPMLGTLAGTIIKTLVNFAIAMTVFAMLGSMVWRRAGVRTGRTAQRLRPGAMPVPVLPPPAVLTTMLVGPDDLLRRHRRHRLLHRMPDRAGHRAALSRVDAYLDAVEDYAFRPIPVR